MGRKAMSDSPKTDRTLRIRLTDAERDEIDRKAKEAGKKSSTWARELLLAAAKSE